MKRRCGRGLVIILLAAITLFFPLLVSRHRIDEAHRDLIREGMTVAEVEDIFGAPPGAYDWAVADNDPAVQWAIYKAYMYLARDERQKADGKPAVLVVGSRHREHESLALSDHMQTWTSRHGSVTIGFNDSGRLTWVGGWHTTHVQPPWQRWWKRMTGK